MNIDDVKAAHSVDYRVSSFKPSGHNESLRKQLWQDMAEFKGTVEIIPAGKTRDLLNFQQLMKGYAYANQELKNSRNKKH